ncbi:MAG: alpha/beta fold hydrolase [Caldilineae bacterium]|nr:MAG: alpha/beta fold hydrolase [Caldilineae bacterium]
MKKKLRGVKRRDIQLDFDLYRRQVPIPGVSDSCLSVLDLWPEGARGTLMFVHGYAGVLESWEFQINHFAREYRVIAPDLRGHGQSDAPLTEYTMPEMVADLEAIVEALQVREPFVLVAHSFGGAIAVEYANAHPERLSKLVLIATAGEYPLPRSARLLLRLPLRLLRPFWPYRPRWDAELHVMKRMAANNMQNWQGWNLLRNIRIPTLVITGERDRYFPRWVFEDVGKMIPNAEVYDVGASKHKVQLERHQAVNRAIERFITDERRPTWRETSYDDRLQQRVWLKHYGKETPHTVPIPRRILPDFLISAANWVPKRTAMIFFGRKWTYAQLKDRVDRFANVLHGMGVRPGDRVAIVLPNMPQLIIAYYATLQIGGVVVFPNPGAERPQLMQELDETEPKVVITLRTNTKLLREVRARWGKRPHVILTDIREAVSGVTYRRLAAHWQLEPDAAAIDEAVEGLGLNMADLLRDAPAEELRADVGLHDLAAILYTSGTVEEPKGVCLSHQNLVANTVQTRHWLGNVAYGTQVCLSVIPLVHSYGMTSAMNIPIALGATIVLLPVFEVQQVLEHIKRYRPTLFPAVPPMYAAINQAPNVRSYGLSSIEACVSGAAPLPVEVQEAFEKLTRGRLVEGYGLTEASPVTHANPLFGLRKPGSIGVPIPNTDAKIVDLVTGAELPPGQVGELIVQGPQVMLGYWKRGGGIAAETQEVLKDGWLYTGDVAVRDGDGYFHIISRKRDMIMSGTYSVFPRDVEEVLYENNKVLETAVVGVGTEDGGQKVKAFVVPRPGVDLTEEELIELCRRRLEPYAVPWEIEFRSELPKSFVGKVLRRMLVEESE